MLRSVCTRRLYSTARTFPSVAYTKGDATLPAVSGTPELSSHQREILDGSLRVDQAGEIAAVWIYKGQQAVLGGKSKRTDEQLEVRVQCEMSWTPRIDHSLGNA